MPAVPKDPEAQLALRSCRAAADVVSAVRPSPGVVSAVRPSPPPTSISLGQGGGSVSRGVREGWPPTRVTLEAVHFWPSWTGKVQRFMIQ